MIAMPLHGHAGASCTKNTKVLYGETKRKQCTKLQLNYSVHNNNVDKGRTICPMRGINARMRGGSPKKEGSLSLMIDNATLHFIRLILRTVIYR